MAVLSSLGPVLAVECSLVGLVVDLGSECVSELFSSAVAFLAQIVTLPEVLSEVLIITVQDQLLQKGCKFCVHGISWLGANTK